MIRAAFALTLATAALVAPLAASAQSVPAGTRLYGTLQQTLDTRSTADGTGFTIKVNTVEPYQSGIVGGTIYGHTADVVRAGQGRKASMTLAFDKIVLPNGTVEPIRGSVEAIQQKTSNNKIAQQAGEALGGMIVGNILGKAIGTNLGGAVGLAGGVVYAANTKSDVSSPAGSSVTVKLTRSLPVRLHQAHR